MNMSLTSEVIQSDFAPDPPVMIRDLITQHRLNAVFQPVGRLQDGSVHAHEALIRGPQNTPLESPAALFELAREQDALFDLELACLETVLKRWGQLRQRGRLFVNLSGSALVQLARHGGTARVTRALQRWGLLARQRPSNSVNLLDRLQIMEAPTLCAQTTCEELAHLLHHHPDLHAVALLDGTTPVGLINRMHFLSEYSKRYFPEVWGRKPCAHLANMQPRIIEQHHRVDELLGILMSEDQRYLSDDFIVVYQNPQWQTQCRHMIDTFNERAVTLFDPTDQQRGGIEAEDRQGIRHFFPFTSLSIGAVQVGIHMFDNAQAVANAAAAAKHAAKQSTTGLALYQQEDLQPA